ncbi:MAG: molecular chaperone DnaJ [Acidobacteriota bacterium]|nr:molecular chaperone DnaJ [Acidobacteriota bacterium]
MEAKRDYYEVLGVGRDADARTIKRAFLRKARTLHPDVNKQPGAEEQFKEVNEAYSALSDERRRANYDRYGDPNGPAGFGGEYVDMSDIFGGGLGDIFDSFFGGGRSSAAPQQRARGRDMGISLRITLEEAASGCTKTISYDRLAPCDDCDGSGVAEGGEETTCSRCGGSGRVVEVQRTIFGQMQSQGTCPVCGGMGRVVDRPCETCCGQGRAPERETMDIEIPAGVHSGQSVRVEGRGEAGVRGSQSGDLVVRVDITRHERYERQGDDLFCRVEVDAFQAMLGTTVTIDGIMRDEDVSVTVPAGCQYGQQVRVEGHGMPRMGTSARGSVMAVIDVRVPDDLSDEERLLLGRVAELRSAATRA